MSEAASRTCSAFAETPGYRIDFEPCAKRVRTAFAGETLADSTQVRLLHETRHLPVYYFPRRDLRMDLLQASGHKTFCPFKGEASYWHVAAGGRRAENAVWSYETPFEEVAGIKDYMAFYWNRMDAWFEEDEEVLVHARDPYVRIDVLDSHRPLEIVLGGETVASTTNGRFLFETGLPTRHYIPRADVRMELLEPSERRSACPYKGEAGYFSVRLGGRRYEDIVWTYADPLPEVAKIRDLLCFYDEKVDAVILDGRDAPKPGS